ncbi:hypothetical protein GPECTOR_9g450 [Gonium pectorale]|uniref:Fatty acid hydroxylase domain-containing protein n=1 Tax=Gonium pectorale TaxID=33097 RepID=A0A150GRA8_GONPE|nr:hypothetical protein GPECTOR_9g450 [Gonium pectorale]|eukprot:KXZ52406.1 hypothetical protein GPECTOR_9g450 [Gonium pectorale]
MSKWSTIRQWFSSFATQADMPKEERLRLMIEENVWKNNLVMWMLPDSLRDQLPHFVQTWLRCWILCAAVYFIIGGIWCYYTYFCFGDKLFAPGTIPAWKDVWEQIRVSNWAIPMYSLLPAVTEMAAEKGWTRAYPRVENVGLPAYVLYFFLYMVSVEFGVYWMHRGLHWGWAYKYLHYDHHKYNKEHTLSPFAGLAFHPLDGILQAVPYTWTLFYCPMHFLTHELLLFATGVWTINIHDCLHGRTWPIMGGGYHTIHHTTYKQNYGHYFVFMDWMMGTMYTPEQYEADRAAAAAKVTAGKAVAAGGEGKKAQ